MGATFKVGDKVRVSLGRSRITGVVTEDRGAIGAHGRRLYQVELPMDPFEPAMYELPEEEMEPVDPAEPPPRLDERQVERYLIHGGLVAILRSNWSGGGNQPRAWLCLDGLGNITHTFAEERGILGGEIVPARAIRGEKIYRPARDRVLEYLEKSFRLDRPSAEKIIKTVGTAP